MLISATTELSVASSKGLRLRVLGARAAPPLPAVAEAELLHLARAEARARRDLGRSAARFLSVHGHQRLGFTRIGDYARERLGIAGRELQSFAAVAAKLDGLPLLLRAFARGEIGWSQTRLLCAVARSDSEAAWLERARGLTVQELVREIRRAAPAGSATEITDAIDEASDSAEGEARVHFDLPCPARVTVLWRRALELARRMLGSEAPVWQAAEAIVAEASSAATIDEVADTAEAPGEAEATAGTDLRSVPDRVPDPRSSSIEEDRNDDSGDPSSFDAFDLDADMLLLVDSLHAADVDLGAALRRFVDLRLHRSLGFSSFDAYCGERLGISPAKARALVAVERRARESAALGSAYRSGEITWSKALAILPVARERHAAAWLTRAQEVTVRRLQDEVAWALDEHDSRGRPAAPPGMGVRLESSSLQICARSEPEVADRRVTFFGPASLVTLFRAGIDGLCERIEPRWKGLERLLLLAISTWEAEPRHRDPIFSRDRWRCSVPGCTSRRSLEDHHIEFRSHGGGNEQANRVAICAAHHHHAIHLGRVRVAGRAPDDLVWELGLRPGRAPLLLFHGERYVSPIVL